MLLFEWRKCWVYRAMTATLGVPPFSEKKKCLFFHLKWKHWAFQLKGKNKHGVSLLWCWYNSSWVLSQQYGGYIFLIILGPHVPGGSGGHRDKEGCWGQENCPGTDHFCVLDSPVTSLTPVTSSIKWAPFYLLSPCPCKVGMSSGSINMHLHSFSSLIPSPFLFYGQLPSFSFSRWVKWQRVIV